MEHSPNAAEGMLCGPSFLYFTLRTTLPCLCLSLSPRKSPLCSWVPGAVQSSSAEDQKEIKSFLHQSCGCANTPSWTQLQPAQMGAGWAGDPGASADISFDKQRWCHKSTDEHLPSAREQGPWEGWASAGVTISSGAFSPNKNIAFLQRLNRDPQDTFFKSQPAEESKGQLPRGHFWLTERQRSVLHS